MALSEKLRRHSGRVTPRFKGRKEILIEEGIEPRVYWDDWEDYRDGFRNCRDRKMLRSKYASLSRCFDIKRWNKKLKRLIFRRKVKKLKVIK